MPTRAIYACTRLADAPLQQQLDELAIDYDMAPQEQQPDLALDTDGAPQQQEFTMLSGVASQHLQQGGLAVYSDVPPQQPPHDDVEVVSDADPQQRKPEVSARSS